MRRRAFKGKQITFWEDKWVLRRVGGRYDSFETMFAARSPILERMRRIKRIRVAPQKGIYEEFFPVILGGIVFSQKLKSLQFKVIFKPRWHILDPIRVMS